MPITRHLYPGGNTSCGFFSYYDQIVSPVEAKRIYILKGGPGVGKSTFMRKIGQQLHARNLDLEYLHCSSDNDSLDGLFAPAIGLLFLDGTSPHVVDPRLPGAVDNIINLGDCLDEAGLAPYAASIHALNQRISAQFLHAYRYLGAADQLRRDTTARWQELLDPVQLHALTQTALDALFAGLPAVPGGRERKLFAGAVTPGGCVCELESLRTKHVWVLEAPWAAPSQSVLLSVRDRALQCGLNVEGYYCAIHPDRLEHLLIPSLDVLLTTNNPYHSVAPPIARTLHLTDCFAEPDANARAQLDQNAQLFKVLLGHAVQAVADAKSFHDELERYYIKHMDYARADALFAQTLERIAPLLP